MSLPNEVFDDIMALSRNCAIDEISFAFLRGRSEDGQVTGLRREQQ